MMILFIVFVTTIYSTINYTSGDITTYNKIKQYTTLHFTIMDIVTVDLLPTYNDIPNIYIVSTQYEILHR